MKNNQVIETETGKLIRFLLSQLLKAQSSFEQGKPSHALIEIEYALNEANISLEDSATLRKSFSTSN